MAAMEKKTNDKAFRTLGTSGGVADKKGNRYEYLCVTYYALKCIKDEKEQCSITLEDPEPSLAKGSDFTFIDIDDALDEDRVCIIKNQVKRQNGDKNSWSLKDLDNLDIFATAVEHIDRGKGYKYNLISAIPCQDLSNLLAISEMSDDLTKFKSQLSKSLKKKFDQLVKFDAFNNDPQHTLKILRQMSVEWLPERKLEKDNCEYANLLLGGRDDGQQIVIEVREIIEKKLRRKLKRRDLVEELDKRGIYILPHHAKKTNHEKIDEITNRWINSIERELLKPSLDRKEFDELLTLLRDKDNENIIVVVGETGIGKSSVVYQAVSKLESENSEILAFRLDRLEYFSSDTQLGAQLELPTSPVKSLLQAADDRDAFLVIDQFEAVSLLSGRHLSRCYDVIVDLVNDAKKTRKIKVVLACRLFDAENDDRLLKLFSRKDIKRLDILPLSDDDVVSAVSEMSLEKRMLTRKQIELLTLPFNLALFKSAADQHGAPEFDSRTALLDIFWKNKFQIIKKKHRHVRFYEVLVYIAEIMSDKQILSVACEELDVNDYINDAEILASEGVLSIENDRISFFHEILFDYTFARQWLNKKQSMVNFLLEHDQGLFRRAQVRQILEMLRGRGDVKSFYEMTDRILKSNEVRSHIKDIALSVLLISDAPNGRDLDIVRNIVKESSWLSRRLCRYISQSSWFFELNKNRIIDDLIDSNDLVVSKYVTIFLKNAVEDGYEEAVMGILANHIPDFEYGDKIESANQSSNLIRIYLHDFLSDVLVRLDDNYYIRKLGSDCSFSRMLGSVASSRSHFKEKNFSAYDLPFHHAVYELYCHSEVLLNNDDATTISDEKWLQYFTGQDTAVDSMKCVLYQCTVKDPTRFADLVKKMDDTIDSTYLCVILWGLANTEVDLLPEGKNVIFDSIAHIIGLRKYECYGIFNSIFKKGSAIDLKDVPIWLVEMIIDCIFQVSSSTSDLDSIFTAGTVDSIPERSRRMFLGSMPAERDAVLCSGTIGNPHDDLFDFFCCYAIYSNAQNSLIELLGRLLMDDTSGERVEIVAPYLIKLAGISSLNARSFISYVIAAVCRSKDFDLYDSFVYCAFEKLIDCDDIIFTSEDIQRLMVIIGRENMDIIVPIVNRMLASEKAEVRYVGGMFAAFANLEWSCCDFKKALYVNDFDICSGAAFVYAGRLGKGQEEALDLLIALCSDCREIYVKPYHRRIFFNATIEKLNTTSNGKHASRFLDAIDWMIEYDFNESLSADDL